ncbi:unnamed protein product [Symbiodinium sp. KB8]|nr:unnamed protein product [Symbiodinium sp. KB8]
MCVTFAAMSRVLLLLIFQGAAGKPRKLFEIGSNDKEVGLDPFYEGNMEPWGAVCVGYVKQDSPNHRLLQKLGANTAEDAELWDLQIPMAAVIDWEEEESLQIVRRNYAARLWEMIEQPPMDAEPVIFAGKSGKKWKEKEVRAWLLENAFPTINYRVAGYQGKQNPFPFDKYFGKSNTGGVGLVLVKIKDINDFGPQFRAVRYLRPHMEKLRGKIRFAVVEKTAKTLEMRQALKVGLNESLESELILFKDLEGLGDRPVGNHWHGNPHKYRLTDLSEESVNAFFEAYYAGKLPTYWASLDEANKAPEDGELASFTFDEQVFKAPKKTGTLVAFFNDASVGCADCERGREGEWLIKLERGWSAWIVGEPWLEQKFHGPTDQPFRYMFGKTEFQVEFQSETEGTSTNLSTGKPRPLCFVPKGQAPPEEAEEAPAPPQAPILEMSERPMQATKADSNLPTCCYLATNNTASYEGEYHWLIELEKGWSPWMPGNEPFDGRTDEPLRYTLGRYDFEVHFEDESHGTQTNLTSGKVRRIQRLRKGDPVPAWEGTGIRRRPANGTGAADIALAPVESAAMAAQSNRAVRRTGGYQAAAVGAPVKSTQKFALRTSKPAAGPTAARPQVSEAAHKATSAPNPPRSPAGAAATALGPNGTVPRFMRPLKSKA